MRVDRICVAGETRIRSLFISDLHLGFRYARTTELLCLLRQYDPDILYVVGDFIDGWYVNRDWHWKPECQQVVARLMELALRGRTVRCVVGNHDQFLRDPLLQQLLNVSGLLEIANELRHETIDGRSFLVTHGDQFDEYERVSAPVAGFLCRMYEWMLAADRSWSWLTVAAGHGPTSLSGAVRMLLPAIDRHVGRFRSLAVRYARIRGFHGVICGHIHSAQHETIDGLTYCNTGDWVESCTALIEDFTGGMQLIHAPAGSVDVDNAA